MSIEMRGLRAAQLWQPILEYAAWCIIWGIAAPVVAITTRDPDSGASLLLGWVGGLPMPTQLLLIWGMSKTVPPLAPYSQSLKAIYDDPNDPWFFLLPSILNVVLLALPMIAVAAFWSRILPAIRRRVLPRRTGARWLQSAWPAYVLGTGVTSVMFLWAFAGVGEFLESVIRQGYENALPPLSNDPSPFGIFRWALLLCATAGVTFIVAPALPLLLRRGLAAAWRRCKSRSVG